MSVTDSVEQPKKKRSKKHEPALNESNVESAADEQQHDAEHEELVKEQQRYLDIVNKIGAAEQQKSASQQAASPEKKRGKPEKNEKSDTIEKKDIGKRNDSRRSHVVSSRLLDEFRRISKADTSAQNNVEADAAFHFIDNDNRAVSSTLEAPMDVSSQLEEDDSKRRRSDEHESFSHAELSKMSSAAKQKAEVKEATQTFTFGFAKVKVKASEMAFASDVRFVNEFEKDWKARRTLVARLVKHRHRLAVSRARQRQNQTGQSRPVATS